MQEIHDGLDFSIDDDNGEFAIFSVKFSTDGRELVAGTNDDSIYVYDLEANKVTLRISAHTVSRELSFPNCWDKSYDLSTVSSYYPLFRFHKLLQVFSDLWNFTLQATYFVGLCICFFIFFIFVLD